jgi:hypothetical protein
MHGDDVGDDHGPAGDVVPYKLVVLFNVSRQHLADEVQQGERGRQNALKRTSVLECGITVALMYGKRGSSSYIGNLSGPTTESTSAWHLARMWGWVARVSPPFYWVLKKGKEIEKKEKERISQHCFHWPSSRF